MKAYYDKAYYDSTDYDDSNPDSLHRLVTEHQQIASHFADQHGHYQYCTVSFGLISDSNDVIDEFLDLKEVFLPDISEALCSQELVDGSALPFHMQFALRSGDVSISCFIAVNFHEGMLSDLSMLHDNLSKELGSYIAEDALDDRYGGHLASSVLHDDLGRSDCLNMLCDFSETNSQYNFVSGSYAFDIESEYGISVYASDIYEIYMEHNIQSDIG